MNISGISSVLPWWSGISSPSSAFTSSGSAPCPPHFLSSAVPVPPRTPLLPLYGTLLLSPGEPLYYWGQTPLSPFLKAFFLPPYHSRKWSSPWILFPQLLPAETFLLPLVMAHRVRRVRAACSFAFLQIMVISHPLVLVFLLPLFKKLLLTPQSFLKEPSSYQSFLLSSNLVWYPHFLSLYMAPCPSFRDDGGFSLFPSQNFCAFPHSWILPCFFGGRYQDLKAIFLLNSCCVCSRTFRPPSLNCISVFFPPQNAAFHPPRVSESSPVFHRGDFLGSFPKSAVQLVLYPQCRNKHFWV